MVMSMNCHFRKVNILILGVCLGGYVKIAYAYLDENINPDKK